MENEFKENLNVKDNSKEKRTFWKFVKEHKKEIIIGAATACAVVVGVIIFKNRTTANVLSIEKVVAKGLKTQGDAIAVKAGVGEVCHAWNLPCKKLINVSEHLRNLPEGWKASQSKIDLAGRYGFSLGDHQTWVNSYTKTVA